MYINTGNTFPSDYFKDIENQYTLLVSRYNILYLTLLSYLVFISNFNFKSKTKFKFRF